MNITYWMATTTTRVRTERDKEKQSSSRVIFLYVWIKKKKTFFFVGLATSYGRQLLFNYFFFRLLNNMQCWQIHGLFLYSSIPFFSCFNFFLHFFLNLFIKRASITKNITFNAYKYCITIFEIKIVKNLKDRRKMSFRIASQLFFW